MTEPNQIPLRTLATATVRGVPNSRIRRDHHVTPCWATLNYVAGYDWHTDDVVTDLVLDDHADNTSGYATIQHASTAFDRARSRMPRETFTRYVTWHDGQFWDPDRSTPWFDVWDFQPGPQREDAGAGDALLSASLTEVVEAIERSAFGEWIEDAGSSRGTIGYTRFVEGMLYAAHLISRGKAGRA